MLHHHQHLVNRQDRAMEIEWIQALIDSPFWTELNSSQRRQWLEKLVALKTGTLGI